MKQANPDNIIVGPWARPPRGNAVACNFGSDSLLMKFKRRLALVSQRNQHDAASPTSVGPGPSRV